MIAREKDIVLDSILLLENMTGRTGRTRLGQLSQNIHHTYFGSPPNSKLDALPVHDS